MTVNIKTGPMWTSVISDVVAVSVFGEIICIVFATTGKLNEVSG